MSDPEKQVPNLNDADHRAIAQHFAQLMQGNGNQQQMDPKLVDAQANLLNASADRKGRTALGPVATANSRLPGLTSEAGWRSMFGPKTDPSTMPQRSIFTPARTDAATNPYAVGALGPGVRDVETAGVDRSMTELPLRGGGVTGMIDPTAPQNTKYTDRNFYQVRPGVSSLPPGVVAGDGVTNYTRDPIGFSTGVAPAAATGSAAASFSAVPPMPSLGTLPNINDLVGKLTAQMPRLPVIPFASGGKLKPIF